MSCFGCCGEDDMHKSADNGPYRTTHSTGNLAAYRATEVALKERETINMQPISVPDISVDELKDVTDNFGIKYLIGEVSYRKVFYGILKRERAAAIKKLDSSKQSDQ